MSNASSVLGEIRRPEYTGENRCLPCTAVNVCIAIAISAALALVWLPFGAGAFAVALLAIYFRGYLVPGTPTLTKRYLPDSVLAYFEHGDPPTGTADPAGDQEWETLQKLEHRRENEVEPDEYLAGAGAIRETERDEFVLTEAFHERIDAELAAVYTDGVEDAAVATLLDVSPVEVTQLDRDYPAVKVDSRVRQWPSESAFVLDVATHEALLATTDDWLTVPLEQRLNVLASLRRFRDTCPVCDGDVVGDQSVVESCCRTFDVVTIACEDCGARLVELPAHEADQLDAPGGTLR